MLIKSTRWTVAHRPIVKSSERGKFHRVPDLELTWEQSRQLAGYLSRDLNTAWWYVPVAEDDTEPGILSDSHKWVPIVENGTLPFDTNPLSVLKELRNQIRANSGSIEQCTSGHDMYSDSCVSEESSK